MLRVGLTGSIAVGKSFVSGVLAELGCRVLDADKTARDVVARGTPGLARITETFGEKILHADGSLDRTQLGAIVFADEEMRRVLNSILHPLIIAAQDEVLNGWDTAEPNGIAVIDAALMLESGGYRRFAKLIVVHCDDEIQLQRLMAREGLTRDKALERIGSQMSQSEKMRYADFLIDTSNAFEDTRKQTQRVYNELKRLRDEKPA